MKKLSIKTAVLVPSLAVLIVGISIMSIAAGVLSSITANNLTNQLIETKVAAQANAFQEMCGGVYEVVAATTPLVAGIADLKFTQSESDLQVESDPRAEVIDVLSKVLMSNEKIIAIWTCWEPNAFDGKDGQYANTSFYDASGRFVPYLYKDENSYQLDALVDYTDPVAGEYYQGAQGTGKPYITDPYTYQVDDVEILICSIAIPILQNGKSVGVVGVDVDLQDFMTLMNSVDILGDGYMFTLSPKGLFASHTDPNLLMKEYSSTWLKNYDAQIQQSLKSGGSVSATSYSDVLDTDVDFFANGLMIGDTGRYWLVCGLVPEKTVNASSMSLLATIIGIGVVLILVVGATIFLLFHNRLKGLPRLAAAADSIAMGAIDLSGLDHETEATKNEISLLERAFFKMASGIKEQADVLSRISRGDYSMTIPIRSDRDVINQAISHMLQSTNQTLHQINSSANQVSIGARQVASSAQSLAKGASEQASSMEELSVSLSEITDKTEQNAKIAKEAAVLSNGIQEKAEKGNAQMSQMMQAVDEIKEASSQIEKVIKVIDDIAFQTNILALNAAVEAARAGQHGKGFAVVAEEVRSLAAKSAESASDTGVMIENAMEKANLGLVIADQTAQSLQEIIDGIKESAAIVAQIERATGDQANAISQINTGIEQVSQVIQQNSSASEESAAASEEMSGQSEMLIQLTSQFNLKANDQI